MVDILIVSKDKFVNKIPSKKLKMESVASSYDDGYDDDDDEITRPNDTPTSISPTNEVILARPSKVTMGILIFMGAVSIFLFICRWKHYIDQNKLFAKA